MREAPKRWGVLTEKEGDDGDETETLIPISTQPISHQAHATIKSAEAAKKEAATFHYTRTGWGRRMCHGK